MLGEIIATLDCMCLPNPCGRLTVAAMCGSVSFEVGVVNFVSTFKCIQDLGASSYLLFLQQAHALKNMVLQTYDTCIQANPEIDLE